MTMKRKDVEVEELLRREKAYGGRNDHADERCRSGRND